MAAQDEIKILNDQIQELTKQLDGRRNKKYSTT